MWFLRINMTDRTYKVEEAPAEYKHLAGRGATSNVVAKEVPPLAHALGPNNKLVFSPGFVTGTSAPTSARISVGGKSPLTGGIKEANAGSPFAPQLADMRIKALVVEGQPKDKGKYWGAYLSWDAAAGKPAVEFFDATPFTGKDLYEVYPKVYEKYPDKVSIAGCGMAGEHGYGNSGVVFDDLAKRPSRYAGRGGLGAVMASKGLKFIVINAQGAPGVEIVDKALFEEGRKKMIDALRTHAITKPKGALNSYGTAVLINILNEVGGLPTRISPVGVLKTPPRLPAKPSSKATKRAPARKSTTMRAARGASFNAPTPGITRTARKKPPVWSMNRIGHWAQIAASVIWIPWQKWFSSAMPMGWTRSRPAPPSASPWKPVWLPLAMPRARST